MNLDQFNKLQKGNTFFTRIARVTSTKKRGNNQVIRLALYDKNITFQSQTFYAVPFDISQFQFLSGLEVDNATFATVLSESFDRVGIKGGKWQGAKIEVFLVDPTNPSLGAFETKIGRFGEITQIGREVKTEYRGLMQLLDQPVGEKTSRLCRDVLGGKYCTLGPEDWTDYGTVVSVANAQRFTISTNRPDKYFFQGEITWITGNNAGLSMETQGNTGQEITLFNPMYRAIQVGDQYSILAGDDKTLHTCFNKFNNAINFFGEPDSPDAETVFEFPPE